MYLKGQLLGGSGWCRGHSIMPSTSTTCTRAEFQSISTWLWGFSLGTPVYPSSKLTHTSTWYDLEGDKLFGHWRLLCTTFNLHNQPLMVETSDNKVHTNIALHRARKLYKDKSFILLITNWLAPKWLHTAVCRALPSSVMVMGLKSVEGAWIFQVHDYLSDIIHGCLTFHFY